MMRLILMFPIFLFTQLLFNQAYPAPKARTATDQFKIQTANETQLDGEKPKQAVKARKKGKDCFTLPSKKKMQKKTKPISAAQTTQEKSHKKCYNHLPTAGIATSNHLNNVKLLKNSRAHKKRFQHVKQTVLSKLMGQMGKPYRWGGSSPYTGFDCSGLIYYAYKDAVKIKIPRTAKEMYQFRHAASIKKSELESGDLVFFRIHTHNLADHVGAYIGNGKFIQSPRSGKEIRISQLNNNYWQHHYIGARRVVTPQTIR
ncbi:Murein DD-endopeptidase MepH [Serratia symbiotica]|nr:Murein DD-endopeptidase MepH [Serratia symbiotica]